MQLLKSILLAFFIGINISKAQNAQKILDLAQEYQKIYVQKLDSVYLEGDFKSILSKPQLVMEEENAAFADFQVTSGPYLSFVKLVLIRSKTSQSIICVYEYNEGTPLHTAMQSPRDLHFYDLNWQDITAKILNKNILIQMDSSYQKSVNEHCTNKHLAENQVFSQGGEFNLSVAFGAGSGKSEVIIGFESIVRTYANLCHIHFGLLIFEYESGKIYFKLPGQR
jgi:hypothetical protein